MSAVRLESQNGESETHVEAGHAILGQDHLGDLSYARTRLRRQAFRCSVALDLWRGQSFQLSVDILRVLSLQAGFDAVR